MAKYDGLSTAEISASISENLSSYEAARSGFFILVVDGLDDLLKPDYKGEAENAEDSDRIKKAQETLKLSVTKCPVPHFEIATNEYRRGNDVVKFAGVPTWNGGTITVADYVGLDTKSLLMSWLYKAYNPHTRKGGRMKDYKKTCTLLEYTQDYQLIRYWTLEGCFITGIEEGDFDRENDEVRQLTVSISFDRAMMYPQHDTI